MDREREIENVARAFYGVDNDEQTWDQASEKVKEAFRHFAKAAVAMIPPCRDDSMEDQVSARECLASRKVNSG